MLSIYFILLNCSDYPSGYPMQRILPISYPNPISEFVSIFEKKIWITFQPFSIGQSKNSREIFVSFTIFLLASPMSTPQSPRYPSKGYVETTIQYPFVATASLTIGYKPAKWWGEGGERGEAGCKFTVGLDTRIKKICERDKLVMY